MGGVGGEAAIVLAALAGGLGALALHETTSALPQAARWISRALGPLDRAGREGYAPSEAERRRLGLLAAAALLFAGAWMLGPAPAAPLAGLGPVAAGRLLEARRARYRRKLERDLPRVAAATADGLAAGRAVGAALQGAAMSVDGPAAVELARVRADLEIGGSLEQALDGLRARTGSPRVDSFCAALLSQRVAGGDLVMLLRRFAKAAEDRDRAAADARSATAQARFTGGLVAAMPVGAALLAELLSPGFVAGLLASGPALVLLALAGILQIAGFALIRRLGGVPA